MDPARFGLAAPGRADRGVVTWSAADLPHGVVTALVTPLDSAGRLDEEGLDRVVDRALAGGVVGLSPCGSTGEGARLSKEQRLRVVRRVRARAGNVAVLPGVPVTAVPDAHEELAELGRIGVTAALVAPPSYYPCDDEDLVRLFTMLADESPVPLVLYNIPVFTGVPLPVDVVSRLAGHPCIVGIKDSSRDMDYLQSVVRALGDGEERSRFTVYTGADTLLLASLLVGADGAIAASSNLVPEIGVDVFTAMAEGDLSQARHSQQRLVQVVTACRQGAFPAGWKAALHLAGVCGPHLAAPAAPLPEMLVERVEVQLRATGVLAQDAPAGGTGSSCDRA